VSVVGSEDSPEVFKTLNKSWKSTCKIVLGREIGGLDEYSKWLQDYHAPVGRRKSTLSGEEVTLSNDHYCNSKFLSFGEKQPEPLSINEIKDIDSLAQAISERWFYSGNKVLGNSSDVQSSDAITSSQNLLYSINIQYSSYLYRCFIGRETKYAFGCNYLGKSSFIIHSTFVFKASRAFESHWIIDSSDAYFSSNCSGCRDTVFCFNLKNAHNSIGNLQLPRDKYLSLKKKIMDEATELLEKNKFLPTLMQMAEGKPILQKKDLSGLARDERGNMDIIRKGFSSTFSLLFRKGPGQLEQYGPWLSKYSVDLREIKTKFGCKTFIPDGAGDLVCTMAPEERMVSEPEALELGRETLDERDIQSFSSLKDNIHKIAFFISEYTGGERNNTPACPIVYFGSNAYKVYDITDGQHAAYSFLSLESDYTYGCFRVIGCKFCINCYNSTSLSRCFELDSCTKCSDAYFCHNSEALADCMFCCNVKGLRNAIGNSPLPPAKYKSTKDSLLEQLGDRILQNNSLEKDIYNIGCSGVKA
jgi:hypothetical protein